jgi:integrase
MARNLRSTGLETRSARLRQPIASKPVWLAIGPGLGLGYRRNKTAGNWVARLGDGKGGYSTRNIGIADDYAEANGSDILDFWQAQAKARQLGKGDTVQEVAILSLGKALDRYEADLRTRGADAGNVSRLRGHLNTAMLRKAVALLSTADLRRWRDGLAKKLAPSSVNRTTAAFKAALNLAADQDERIGTRRAWEIGLATIKGADEARNVILPEAVVRGLIAEARAVSPEFGLLIEVAAVTGARVSQLARIEVQDLHGDTAAPRISVPVSHKGNGPKAVPRRSVPIGSALAARLRVAAANRPVTEPLLTKPSGEPWRKSDHSRLFARAARAAGQDPEEVTMYALRHTSIVRQLLAAVPIRVVAQSHDTSVAMIEKNYSRHIGDHSDAVVRAAMLDMGDDATGNVVPIRPSVGP